MMWKITALLIQADKQVFIKLCDASSQIKIIFNQKLFPSTLKIIQ